MRTVCPCALMRTNEHMAACDGTRRIQHGEAIARISNHVVVLLRLRCAKCPLSAEEVHGESALVRHARWHASIAQRPRADTSINAVARKRFAVRRFEARHLKIVCSTQLVCSWPAYIMGHVVVGKYEYIALRIASNKPAWKAHSGGCNASRI